jgi:hypothetical protein
MDNANTEKLKLVLEKYGVPDPSIVGKLPKGGAQLDYVSHAEITKILIEIDPHWRWVPIEWNNGRPAIHIENGIATMWGELTLLGQSRLGVGSVRADKQELDKELVGDLLRNAAMRFGIALKLWSKQEWDENNAAAQHQPGNPGKGVSAPVMDDPTAVPLSDERKDEFAKACTKAGLNPMTVAKRAKVNLGKATVADRDTLLAMFKIMVQELKEKEQPQGDE